MDKHDCHVDVSMYEEKIPAILKYAGVPMQPEEVFRIIHPASCFTCKGDKFRVAMWRLMDRVVIELDEDLQLRLFESQ